MGAPAKNYHSQRQDKCLHLLERMDPIKNDGFRYYCIRPDCGKFLKTMSGVLSATNPSPNPPTKEKSDG